MFWKNAVIIGILVIIVGSALWYIIKKKRAGTKCIGCPDSENCKNGCCGCRK